MTPTERKRIVKEQRAKIEFGDFQTPLDTAKAVCKFLSSRGVLPQVVIEPTCGVGAFLAAAVEEFKSSESFVGFDINANYIDIARERLSALADKAPGKKLLVEQQNFFDVDWAGFVGKAGGHILFLGNPPWVTNSALGALAGTNLPEKTNLHGHTGLAALTGKSNFDISEWMLLRLLEVLQTSGGTVAMLCKTSVARKVLKYAHDRQLKFGSAEIVHLDSKVIFDVSVDACLFLFKVGSEKDYTISVISNLSSPELKHRMGFFDGKLVADLSLYASTRSVDGEVSRKWRSGLKHDCSSVMELFRAENGFVNSEGQRVDVEDEYVYPLLKSSDLSKSPLPLNKRAVIVTQKSIGAETRHLKDSAPRLWHYLASNQDAFERRKSSIYRNKPPFSIFGIGDYSFANWKVAISGLYKTSVFKVIPPFEGKPVMFDDTCYFLPCVDEEEARAVAAALNSEKVQDFIRSIVFWDAKRPINAELLQRINIEYAFKKHLNDVNMAKSEVKRRGRLNF